MLCLLITIFFKSAVCLALIPYGIQSSLVPFSIAPLVFLYFVVDTRPGRKRVHGRWHLVSMFTSTATCLSQLMVSMLIPF